MARQKAKKSRQNLLSRLPKTYDFSAIPTTPPHHLRKRNKAPALIYVGNAQTLTQSFIPRQPEPSDDSDDEVSGDDKEPEGPSLSEALPNVFSLAMENEPAASVHMRRRTNQVSRWNSEILPQLLGPYMALLRQTQNLRLEPDFASTLLPCTCPGNTISLEVTVVTFDRLDKIRLFVCHCPDKRAAIQLLQRGLFPCAPLHPTLAVDMKLLDLVTKLFLRVPPNQTAWSSALEDFIAARGYRLQGEDPLRRRFANALQWYNALQFRCEAHLDGLVAEQRQILLEEREQPSSETSDEEERFWTGDGSMPHENERPGGRTVGDESGSDDEDQGGARKRRKVDFERPKSTLRRPSEYLRSRCPLCFGGDQERRHSSEYVPSLCSDKALTRLDLVSFDAIVCVDACFTQKHNKQKHRDPRKEFHKSVFVPDHLVKEMQRKVDSLRPRRDKKKKPSKKAEVEVPDGLEGPLKVPTSVLDGCEESFTAADERREKASTKYFDCTALMGLLCRHDRVLWLVNMDTAGERQHFVLVLLDLLFEHLPPTFIIGLLYDIGCQLHRSCVKWGFLERYLHRISFAISIFHAFGHGWPCQLVYHPRKARGFGLSDGEGCERFWHSISKLIPYLRVAGYHHRVYTLDTQINHLDKQNLQQLGRWLARKHYQARMKLQEAEYQLDRCKVEESVLRKEWADQIAEQTKPLPGKYRHLSGLHLNLRQRAKKAVEEVIRLRETQDELERECSRLTSSLTNPRIDAYDHLDTKEQLVKRREEIKRTSQTLRQKERLLGVKEQEEVRHLLKSPYLRARMNALALKTRLMQKLRSRKFERDRIERSFRKTQSEQRAHHQIEDSVKRKDPGIQQIARRYNKLCTEIQGYINRGQASDNAVAPKEIPLEGLFSLDIDDDIWQDVGLSGGDDDDQPPLWLSDENVRTGMRFLLQRDRCEEEFARLQEERDAMQTWFREEWDAALMSIEQCDDQDERYMLQGRRSDLAMLCARWIEDLRSVKASIGVPEWGPSTKELEFASTLRVTEVVEELHSVPSTWDEEEELMEDEMEDVVDAGLYEHLAMLDLSEEDEYETE
ncbi:hypothetical protein AAF712_014098 [Marasmius tenuissimus]|uniref:CxC2-like cysteine cluster KDZ transposase-associated domain-containing protein n=1 Tax=Marasmius tenuissimus TaxID=585030 RepID=A0ABR2ZBX9_9AGAR